MSEQSICPVCGKDLEDEPKHIVTCAGCSKRLEVHTYCFPRFFACNEKCISKGRAALSGYLTKRLSRR